jgi:predicted O-methyltransferase YrrM
MPFVGCSHGAQDRWIHKLAVEIEGLRNGTFLDIGCGHPINGNNTFELECRGWRGLLVDINSDMKPLVGAFRASPFVCMDAAAIDWTDVLRQHTLPSVIDYLSFDVDGTSVPAFLNLPLDRVRFRYLTVEHDFYAYGGGPRALMRYTLARLGYDLLCPDVTIHDLPYEDWWIDPSRVDSRSAEIFRTHERTECHRIVELCSEPIDGDPSRKTVMGGLLAAMREQDPVRASEYERHFTAPNHYQDNLRGILFAEIKDGGSPRTIVETGVSYGISSDRILAALDDIGIPGHGLLYSIDSAPPAGIFEVSHPRWAKFRQMSTEALPQIYERTGPWDIFLHDSDHEVWCQTFEYEVAWHFVRGGGLIMSDDATWGTPPHRAWDRFCLRHGIDYTMAGHCAVARKPVAIPGSPTTRVDREWIDSVMTHAIALADAAEREYAEVKGR